MTDFGINWNLLRAPDIGGAFTAGLEHGAQQKRAMQVRGALAAFAQNPDDPGTVSELMALDPSAGIRAAEYQRQRTATTRDERFRSALSGYLAPAPNQPAANALQPAVPPAGGVLAGVATSGDLDRYMPGLPGAPVGAPQVGNALSPQQTPVSNNAGLTASPADISPEHLGALNQHHSAWREMVATDPVKAMEFRRQQYTDLKSRLDVTRNAYSFAIGKLANVSNDEEYQDVLDSAGAMFSEVGVNVRDFAPPTYPGPQGIRQLLNSAMDAKDQVVALDRRAKLDWDIRDDEIDNARSDRSEQRQNYFRARSDSRAERADRRSAVRFGERDKDRAAVAASGGLRTDLSDLDY